MVNVYSIQRAMQLPAIRGSNAPPRLKERWHNSVQGDYCLFEITASTPHHNSKHAHAPHLLLFQSFCAILTESVVHIKQHNPYVSIIGTHMKSKSEGLAGVLSCLFFL